MNNKNYAEVLEHLSALRSGPFWEIFFSADLEERYQLSQNDWYRESIRVSSLLAIALLIISYFAEAAIGLNPPWQTLLMRAVAASSMLGAYFYIRRSINLTWKYWVVTANAMLVVAALLVLASLSSPPVKLIYYSNVFFVEVVVFTFIRLPLNFTSTLGLVLLLMAGCTLYWDTMNLQVTAHVMFFLITGTAIAVMVAIKTEKMSRESFLKSELIHFEKNQLRALNERLNEQISQDRVTHLLNRVSFEDRLLVIWNAACQHKRSLCLVAVHIEQFAYFNEQNGNDAGDDLLREVARRIRTVLDGQRTEISRLSGGRFLFVIDGLSDDIDNLLEKLRGKLNCLTALERDSSYHRKVFLSWGRVSLEPESDRDPRGVIDRMFKHLVPISDEGEQCYLMNPKLMTSL